MPTAVVRLISATNVSKEDMKAGTVFRPDLLYRLNTVEISLPPLRERLEDIPLLADAFLAQYARKYNRPTHGFTNGALDVLAKYSWPGNIRELRHSIERGVILSEGKELTESDFASLSPTTSHPPSGFVDSENKTLDEVEKSVIETTLATHQGNISKAAKDLGLTRTSLYRRIEKYGL